jgi:hypothetical protein
MSTLLETLKQSHEANKSEALTAYREILQRELQGKSTGAGDAFDLNRLMYTLDLQLADVEADLRALRDYQTAEERITDKAKMAELLQAAGDAVTAEQAEEKRHSDEMAKLMRVTNDKRSVYESAGRVNDASYRTMTATAKSHPRIFAN